MFAIFFRFQKYIPGIEYARTAYHKIVKNSKNWGIEETYYPACKAEYHLCNQSNSQLAGVFNIFIENPAQKNKRFRDPKSKHPW